MKLNQVQRYALLNWLSKNIRNFFNLSTSYNFDEFCDGDITEWRVISDFGMAGKLWNNCDRIYITGYSPCEIGVNSKEWKKHLKQVEKWNEEIAEVIGMYSF